MSRTRKTFTARQPVDLLAVVPYLLGFHPEDSVVLMTFGPGEAFHARVDLPVEGDAQRAVADMLAGVVVQHGVARVAVLVYTDDPWTAATFHDVVVPAMVGSGVDVLDVLRVGRDRFHSAADPHDRGTAYDLTTHPFTAQQVVEGTVVHHNRAELAASLDPVDPIDAAAVAEIAGRVSAQHRGVRGLVQPERVSRELLGEAVWIQRTLARGLDQSCGTALPVEDAGRLVALAGITELRDVAWAEMSRHDAARHVELWRDLVRRCPPDLLAAPASLLAFAAWLAGNGALAWCALDRVAAVDRAYPMAGFVATLLEQAVPPATWSLMSGRALPGDPGDAPAAS